MIDTPEKRIFPDGHSSDDGQHEAMAMPNTDDPLAWPTSPSVAPATARDGSVWYGRNRMAATSARMEAEMVEQPRWTKADARSLARKMVDFMNTLTPGEQALLEDKIRRTMPDGEVQGYEWILESQDAPEGAEHRFEVWVWED